MSRTNFGNWVRATGGFLPAAQSMGIPTARVKIACFMICSVLAGFAGTIQVMRLGAPLPSIGEGLELQAVAAAVIGGASLAGGIGTIFGGIIGAALIRVIDNGLVLSQVDANWFKMAIGAADHLRRGRERLAAQARPGDEGGDLTMAGPIIEISNLHKWYSGVHALKGVSLDI